MKEIHINEVLKEIKGEYSVKGVINELFIDNIKPITEADDKTLAWINPTRKDKNELLQNTKANIVICDNSIEVQEDLLNHKCLIIVSNPKLVFINIANKLFIDKLEFGVHENTIIHKEAIIEKNVYIGPNTYIGKAVIGSGSIIHGNCFIYDKVSIGNNVIIHAGSVIGADGFGFARNDSGELIKFPHIGSVKIETDVEIGSNTCVDRGSLGETLIKKGAKIDNFVHIAHNVIIGKHTAVIAHAMVGGSTVIGDYSWIAPSAVIRDAINIGNNVVVGLGAVVTKNIPDNEIWAGLPAKKIK